MTLLSAVRDRLYGDFLMPSRLDAYRRLLEQALAAGYRVSSVGGFWQRLRQDTGEPIGRSLLLRHDVDTDRETAAAMWRIDRALGVQSSWFFRLSTLDPALMDDIAAAGSEASYHYEELATVAKHRRLRSREDGLRHLPEARDRFAANIARLRDRTGLPMRVVASHGDFVNRRLGLPNWLILSEATFRQSVGVDLETYDEALLRHLPSRHADEPHPRYWAPTDPVGAIAAGEPTVSILVHPRQWRVSRLVNARDDLQRVVEGVRFSLPL